MISSYQLHKGKVFYLLCELNHREGEFKDQLFSLFKQYDEECYNNNLNDATTVYVKLYVSDVTNQSSFAMSYIRQRNLFGVVIGMPPASGAMVALEAFHMVGEYSREVREDGVYIKHGKYESIWNCVLPSQSVQKGDSFIQTEDILNQLSQLHKPYLVKDIVHRTWFYVRDIDNNYAAFVKSRMQWFEKNGMTKSTHFISSTGIEGTTCMPSHLVSLFSYAERGLQEEQVQYLSATDYLNPTHEYNVTFERGTCLQYGDMRQYFISGTASIDKNGVVVYPGEVCQQIERIRSNIDALLHDGGSSVCDISMMIVYVRDPANYNYVRKEIESYFPDVPYLLLKGSVCRTDWVIEIECIAFGDGISSAYNDFY